MKRNICIENGLDYVIIETEKEPEIIIDFCIDYVKKTYSMDYSWNYNDIGKVLFDTVIDNELSDDIPETNEFYNLHPFFEKYA